MDYIDRYLICQVDYWREKTDLELREWLEQTVKICDELLRLRPSDQLVMNVRMRVRDHLIAPKRKPEGVPTTWPQPSGMLTYQFIRDRTPDGGPTTWAYCTLRAKCQHPELAKRLEALARMFWAIARSPELKTLGDLREVIRKHAEILRRFLAKRRPRVRRADADARARETLKLKPQKGHRRWSQRTLCKVIGCGAGQVGKLDAWQKYAERHGLNRAKIRRAVGLTKRVLETVGKDDEELKRLLGEQKADREPSPLDAGRHIVRAKKKT